MRFKEHKQKWKDCTNCELCEQRRKIVLLRGKVPCQVLFVGEAPGPSEDALGRPFVGPAGQLLDSIIDTAVSNAGEFNYAITNLVACFPADAKSTTNHQPPVSAIKACTDRLVEVVVSLCRPGYIICVGSLAAKWVPKLLAGHYNGEYREIIHPAAILRMDQRKGVGMLQRGLARQRCEVVIETVIREL